MREMAFRTPSESLRDIHRDVWRIAHARQDRGDGNRSFLFRRWRDGIVFVRGPYLPAQHSVGVDTPEVGGEYLFDLLVRAVRRNGRVERPVETGDMPLWLARHLAGFDLLSMRCSRSRSFSMGDGTALYGYHVRGRVRVADVDAALGTLRAGVGRSKGFGFGMLVVQKADTD